MEYLKNLFKRIANQEVKVLDLAIHSLDDKLSALLVEALQKNKSIESLRLYFFNVREPQRLPLLHAIGRLPNLKHLEITGGIFNEEAYKDMIEGLSYAKKLETLKLSNMEMTHTLAKYLAHTLSQLNKLHLLAIQNSKLIDEELAILAKEIIHHPSLKTLNLWMNWLSSEGAALIADILKENRVLYSFVVAPIKTDPLRL